MTAQEIAQFYALRRLVILQYYIQLLYCNRIFLLAASRPLAKNELDETESSAEPAEGYTYVQGMVIKKFDIDGRQQADARGNIPGKDKTMESLQKINEDRETQKWWQADGYKNQLIYKLKEEATGNNTGSYAIQHSTKITNIDGKSVTIKFTNTLTESWDSVTSPEVGKVVPTVNPRLIKSLADAGFASGITEIEVEGLGRKVPSINFDVGTLGHHQRRSAIDIKALKKEDKNIVITSDPNQLSRSSADLDDFSINLMAAAERNAKPEEQIMILEHSYMNYREPNETQWRQNPNFGRTSQENLHKNHLHFSMGPKAR